MYNNNYQVKIFGKQELIMIEQRNKIQSILRLN